MSSSGYATPYLSDFFSFDFCGAFVIFISGRDQARYSKMSGNFPTAPHRRTQDPKMIGLWKIGRTIGKGASGRVRIARHSKNGQYAAVKIVSKQSILNSRMSLNPVEDEAERILQALEREIVIMKLIDHPNILRLYDVWETSAELYLILEYAEGGELFDYIQRTYSWTRARNSSNRRLWYGCLAGKTDLLNTACGSPHYAAPEVIDSASSPYNGTASDVWSCGVILYALLTGRLPFDDEDIIPLLEKVRFGKYTLPPGMDPQAKDLITKMLQKDPKKRITVSEILSHPFCTSQPLKAVNEDIPTLEQLARPLASAGDVDQDILANLRTLWRNVSDEQLIRNLTSDENTWDKLSITFSRAVRKVAFDLDSPSPEHEAGPSTGLRKLTAVASETFIAERTAAESTHDFEEVRPPTPGYEDDMSGSQDDKIQYFWNQGGDAEAALPDVPSPPPPLTLDLGTPFTTEDTFKNVAKAGGTRPLSIRRRKRRMRSEDSSMRANRHINVVEPAKLQKKRSVVKSKADLDATSPTSSGFSSRTDGSSYFFSTSPRPSIDQDAAVSRRECRKILESMGVSVMLIQAEGMGTLKCKLPEAKDPAGVMATVKAVKFRAIAGYTGANSSFRLVYSRLRREWDLDAAPTKCMNESRPMEQGVEIE
ncbi:kinase-like domain-containing protein [Irpex lacteus]|nr:kinase-like domain-containing protein [Irpex lacteus]